MIPLNQSQTFEHYKVLTNSSGRPIVLSSDGSGITYRAIDNRNDQPVILRVFSEKLLSDCSVQTDFVKNARLLIELDHASITRIVDTGQSDNQFFYVLQDPGGATVHELVERDGPLDVSKTLRLHGQLSEALIGLRTQPDLMSRVWPRNLIVSPSESTGVFLVAQNLITPTSPIEDAEYLAPEILAGHAETAQTTLYSIGATMYYMLTGKPPFPPMQRSEDILELKSSQRADASLLPPTAPIMLIKQLLEPDARNRPKSLMEWDRALQRFIRFTPDTGAITLSPETTAPTTTVKATRKPEAATPPLTENSQAPAPNVSAFVPSPTADAPQSDTELRKAKVHTQRLSLELTKRVQKELALTEQLKSLEGELEKERQALRELREDSPKKAKKQPAGDRTELENQWETLRKARTDLEREKNEFLKKTQRFSLQQLKAEAAKTSRATPTTDARSTPAEEEMKAEKPRLFRFRKRSPKPTHTPSVKDSKEKGKVTSNPEIPAAPSEPAEITTRVIEVAPKKPAAATSKPEPAAAATSKPEPAAAATSKPEPAATAKKGPTKAVTPFSVPTSVTANAPREAAARQEAPSRCTAKPTPTPKPAAKESDKVVTFATPFSKGVATAGTQTTKPPSTPQTLTRTPKPRLTSPATQQDQEIFEREVAAKVSDHETTKITVMPEMEPTRGAWSALSVLGLVIGVGLFIVYRTFFSTDNISMIGNANAEPLVVDYWPDETEQESIVKDASNIETNDPDKPTEDLVGVEDKLNEELRVEMRVFDNFLLLQDQEWAELLHGLKNLERQADKYSPAELNQVRTELLEDLQRTAQLKKDSQMEENKGYQELLAYLLSVVIPDTSANSTSQE